LRKVAVKSFSTAPLRAAVAVAGLVTASPSMAALGGDASSVEADRVSMISSPR